MALNDCVVLVVEYNPDNIGCIYFFIFIVWLYMVSH